MFPHLPTYSTAPGPSTLLTWPGQSPTLRRVLEAFASRGSPLYSGGAGALTLCPNHDDRTSPSLSLRDGDEGVLVHCFTCGDHREVFESVVNFTGLSKPDFFYSSHAPSSSAGPVATIDALAAVKKLPPELMRQMGWQDSPRGILIPYWPLNPNHAPRVRIRRALRAGDGSFWDDRTEERITTYGAWLVPTFRSMGTSLYLVEGESDAVTAWHHGLPAIGFPGKTSPRAILQRTPDLVAGFDHLFLVEEPDDRDDHIFLESVRRGLTDAHWSGQVFSLRLPVKDLSDLHVQRPGTFWQDLQSAWAAAVDAPTWPEPQAIPVGAAEVAAIITAPGWPETWTSHDVARRARHLRAEAIRAALQLLEGASIVRRVPSPRRVGRPAERFRTHPGSRR